MRSSLFLIISLYASQAFATCDISPTKLTASYQITATDGNKHHTSELVLWRNGKTVAHQYPQTHITESWYLAKNQLIKPTRFFDNEQRAIEYQPGEKVHGKAESDWNYRYKLISDTLLSQLNVQQETGAGCEQTRIYTKSMGDTKIEVRYLTQQNLVSYYSWQKGSTQEVWTLQNVTSDTRKINVFFDRRAAYQSTDFADIGDDHSDAFLTKMVTLGFIEKGASGFYDDKGHALDGGHQH